MRHPAATELALDPRLKTFAAEFLNEWRGKKRRDHGKPFVRPEYVDGFADFRERMNSFFSEPTTIRRNAGAITPCLSFFHPFLLGLANPGYNLFAKCDARFAR